MIVYKFHLVNLVQCDNGFAYTFPFPFVTVYKLLLWKYHMPFQNLIIAFVEVSIILTFKVIMDNLVFSMQVN